MDVQKALALEYDGTGLLHAQGCTGFGERLLNVIRDMYIDRVWVKVDGRTRARFKSSLGVRQGSLI